MTAPDVVDAEVLSALRGLERGAALKTARGAQAVADLSRAPLRRVSSRSLLAEAWRHRHNLSAYDALYVALANRLGAPLLTADRRLSTGTVGEVGLITI